MSCLHDLKRQLILTAAIVDVFLIVSYSAIAIVSFRNRNIFHPFFSLLFSLLFLSYAMSDLFEFIYSIIDLFFPTLINERDIALTLCELVYFYSSPCAVCLLLERCIASRYPKEYEKARPWIWFWILQPICFLIAGGVLLAARWTLMMTDDIQRFIIVIQQIIIISMLLFLFIYNRQRTKNSAGSGVHLGTRYQLTENIRVLKLLLPVIICDLAITLSDIISGFIYTTALLNTTTDCSNSASLSIFIVFKVTSLFFQITVSLLVVLLHPSFKCCGSRICPTWKRTGPAITNVLGKKINGGQSTDGYFSWLQKAWGDQS